MIEITWKCPYCGGKHRTTVRSVARLSPWSQIRSGLVTHFAQRHASIGAFVRSQIADRMTREMLPYVEQLA